MLNRAIIRWWRSVYDLLDPDLFLLFSPRPDKSLNAAFFHYAFTT
jgi:hypothetical protein